MKHIIPHQTQETHFFTCVPLVEFVFCNVLQPRITPVPPEWLLLGWNWGLGKYNLDAFDRNGDL